MYCKQKLLTSAVLSLFTLTITLPQPSHAIVDKIKGAFTSDKKITLTTAQELQSLLNVESLLIQINSLQKEVHTTEKHITKPELELRKKLEDTYNRSRIIIEQVTKQTNEEIAQLRKLIDARKGKISDLQKALKQEDKIFDQSQSLIQTYLSTLQNLGKNNQPFNKDKVIKDIEDHKQRIAELYKAINQRDDMLKDILNAKAYKELSKGLNAEILKLINDIVKAIEDSQKLRQTEIFDKNNNNADEMLASLKSAIKDSNCLSIKDIGTATQKNIDGCKNDKINTIYKKTKLSSCLALTPKSKMANVQQCINDVS